MFGSFLVSEKLEVKTFNWDRQAVSHLVQGGAVGICR